MTKTADFGEIIEALRGLSRAELEEIRDAVSAAAVAAPDQTSPGLQGTPRDTAVQKLAAHALRLARDPMYRKHWTRIMNEAEVMTYDAIGESIAGVTRERVRMLYERLCPFQYEAERRASSE